MNIIDFHSHIIPYIDDGAENFDVAEKLLSVALAQGVSDVVATPHFSASEKKIMSFVEKRAELLNELKGIMDNKNISYPNIYQGAEVSLRQGLSEYTSLNALCVENTNYILVEMPYTMWYDWVFDELYSIIYHRQLIPIIAHTERYISRKNEIEKFDKLFSLDVVLQFNANSFCNFNTRQLSKMLIRHSQGLPIVIGSDCHDLKKRNIFLDKSLKKLQRSYGKNFCNHIIETSNKILKNEQIDFNNLILR